MRMIGELDYKPTRWQKKTLWAAITFLSVAVIATLAVLLLQVVNKVLGYLQPLLIPIAVAGVMAFLFEPLVLWLVARKIPRFRAVILIFFAVTGLVLGLLTWLLPTVYIESQGFASR